MVGKETILCKYSREKDYILYFFDKMRRKRTDMGYIDIHSHILPGVDDGAQDLAEALEMLRIAQGEGITDIILTPHYRSGRFKTDGRQMQKLLEELRRKAEAQKIAVRLYPGSEIYYHSELEEKLSTGEVSTMNGTEYLLVEFSPMDSYLYLRNAMEELLGMGYRPILAHAERYQCICSGTEYVKDLKKMGCDIQVNASSVIGEGGFRCKRFVHKILKEQLVDYIGTDAHGISGRKPEMKRCAEVLYKKCDRLSLIHI